MSYAARRLVVALAAITVVVVIVVVGVVGVGRSNEPSASAGRAEGTGTDAAPGALGTPVLSARRVPELVRANIADQRLRAAVEPLLAQAPADSCVVVSSGGRPVIRQRGDAAMVPASTQKLLIGAAVLDTFSEDHRLTTTVAAARAPRDGVVEGDLYLIGGGDPLLTTPGYARTFENPQQLAADAAQLADRVVAAGVREVRGGVIGDDSRYDDQRWIPSWPQRYQREGYVGPISALTINDGTSGFSGNPDGDGRERRAGDPPALAAETLITLLQQRGVQVQGGASAGRAPQARTEVATLPSMPMIDLVREMLADSDNTTAEMLVKELGLARAGQGTTVAGLAVVTDAASADGLPTAGLGLKDGSGLDPQNKVTCDLLVAALDRHGPASVLGTSLPTAGETGTLRKRMRNTPAQGRVQAKTGTLAEVNALAGFATTATGGQLTFAYLVNGGNQPRGYAPIDELAAALVGVPDGPPIDQLSPRPAGT